jgi:hypothetical protein
MVLSCEADTICLPSGVTANPRTFVACPPVSSISCGASARTAGAGGAVVPSEAKSALSFRMSFLVAFVGCCQCASHSLDGRPPRRLTTHHAIHDHQINHGYRFFPPLLALSEHDRR